MIRRTAIGLLPGNHPWRRIPLKDVPGITAFECIARRYVAVSEAFSSSLTFDSVPKGFLARYVLMCERPDLTPAGRRAGETSVRLPVG